MATEAQIKANRQNAQKSTGPKTDEGKAAVAQNALKHGLFAAQDVLTVEDQAEFDFLREQMIAELAPVGTVESLIARRAVSLAWRLRRAERMQDEVIQNMLDSHAETLRRDWGPSPEDPRHAGDYLALGRIATKDWSNERILERLLLYERRLEVSLYQTIAKLRAVQLMRELKGEDPAAAQHPAQVQEETDLKKQSQFLSPLDGAEALPDGTAPLPPALIHYLQTAYGYNPPQWVRARLRQAGLSFKGGNGSKGVGTGRNGRKKHIPLNLLNF